jgi:hypothetical protein
MKICAIKKPPGQGGFNRIPKDKERREMKGILYQVLPESKAPWAEERECRRESVPGLATSVSRCC